MMGMSTEPDPDRVTANDRYVRQTQFRPFGQDGQAKLNQSSVAIIGVGALGSVIAERLTRSGVGKLRLIDRDWVELSNLSRQTLFTERDASESLPKALAAKRHLAEINSSVDIEIDVTDATYENIETLVAGCDLIMDGTDNFLTRFLINDVSLKNGIPWVHGGCVGALGQVAAFVPGKTACFRCLISELPPADQMATCDSVGVLGPAVSVIASWQAMEAMKLMSKRQSEKPDGCQLITIDLWNNEVRKIHVPIDCEVKSVNEQHRSPGCPACQQRRFEFLDGKYSSDVQVLCGRNAVQLKPSNTQQLNLDLIANRLQSHGDVVGNRFMLRFKCDGMQISLFVDGRAVVNGTEDPTVAKNFVARWIGI